MSLYLLTKVVIGLICYTMRKKPIKSKKSV